MNKHLQEFSIESKMINEIEKVYFAKIKDFEQLEKARHKETIEQWDMRSKPSGDQSNMKGNGCVRVRCYDGHRYELTIKNYFGGNKTKINTSHISALEKDISIDKEAFEIFRSICPIGFVKTRYTFPVNSNLKFDIDVFHDKEGKLQEWCKIDVEMKHYTDQIPEWPVDFEEIIDRHTCSEETGKFVNNLYQEKFNLYNNPNILPMDDGSHI